MAQLYTNNATSTLASSIISSDLSLTVATGEGALFPTISGSNYFYCTLDDGAGSIEIVKVTARSTDTFTIVRAQEGTTAQGFAGGVTVELRLTAGTLSSFAVAGTSGNSVLDLLYQERKDTLYAADDFFHTGSGLDTGGTRFSSPSPTAWSTRNFTAASQSVANRRLTLRKNANNGADGWAQAYQAKVAGTSIYRAEFHIGPSSGTIGNSSVVGMHLRDSAGGKMLIVMIGFSGTWNVQSARWTNETTFSANVTSTGTSERMGCPHYFEIETDATKYYFRYSRDGIAFIELHNETFTNFLGTAADQIGLCAFNSATTTTDLVARAFYRIA